jgi:hypothetical protein
MDGSVICGRTNEGYYALCDGPCQPRLPPQERLAAMTNRLFLAACLAVTVQLVGGAEGAPH